MPEWLRNVVWNLPRNHIWKPIATPFHRGRLCSSIPSPTVSDFLTVNEAARLTGKSSSSIRRRLIYPIIHDDKHRDRHHIQPSPAEALEFRTKGENFAWRLSEELLRREVPIQATTEKADAPTSRRGSLAESGDLLAMLRSELEIKNHQIAQQSELIAKQMQLIDGLSERMHESNVLIGSLQQGLALTDGKQRTQFDSTPPKQTVAASPEKGSKTPSKTSKPKRTLLFRLFG
jgi:hypothetical protein